MEATTERLNSSKCPIAELIDADADADAAEALAEEPESGATRCILPGGVVRANSQIPRVAGYEILEELGRGGMGVVYKAWQKSLRRTVALKMILAGSFAGSQELERFRNEAMAVARLHHPHLLSIYEIGESQQLPFYAMEYMEGGSLARRLNGQPIDPRVAAGLVRALADAMDYAHKNGIVHRDLKPANILLQIEDCRLQNEKADPQFAICNLQFAIPKITDFGIAKHLHDDTNYTRTGDILGTPHYMAPEQATGDSAHVGPTADVYSLGAILYELLTGRAPFHGYEGAAVLIRMTREELDRPSVYVPGLPRDLQTICLKCLEKDPARRYASAAGLADDLGRYLQSEPIQAKPASLADRAFKWARRRPAWAAIIGMTIALALVGFGLMAMMWRQAVQHAEQRGHTLNALKALLADDYLERGIHLAGKGDVRRGMHLMVRALEVAEEIEQTEKKANPLTPVIRMNLSAWSQCVNTREAKLDHRDWVWDVAFSPDRKFVLTASKDKRVKIWDAETAQQVGAALQHAYPVWGLAFHPDGRTLFTLSSDPNKKVGALHVWSADADQPGHFTPRGAALELAADVSTLRLNTGGDRLWITSFSAGKASLLEFNPNAEGNGLRLLASLDGAHADGVFSPDDATLATIAGTRANPGKEVRLWDARTASPLGTPLPHQGLVRAAVFSKDGRHLIVGSATDLALEHGETSLLHVWDWARNQCVAKSPPLFGQLKAMALAPSGQLFAVSLFEYVRGEKPADPIQITNGHVALWQLHADGKIDSYGQPLRTENAVWSMAFSPDSRFLLAGARNFGASLWSVSNCQLLLPVQWHEGNCVKVAFRGDGRQVVTASAGGNNYAAARLWEVPSFAHIGLPMPQPHPIRAAFWEQDGKHAWFGCGAVLCQWDPERGVKTAEHKLPRFAYFVHPTTDERRFILDFGIGQLHDFERATNAWPVLANYEPKFRLGAHLEFQRNHRRIFQHWPNPSAFRLLDDTGKPVTELISAPEHELLTWAISPNGDVLALAVAAVGKPVYQLRLYDAKNLALLKEFPLKNSVITMAYSPDGTTIAMGGSDRQVQRLNVQTGVLQGPPLLLETNVMHTRFVRDSRLLMTQGEKGQVLLWDAPTGKRVGPAFEHHTDLITISVHPKGEAILTATTGRMAMTWRVPDPATGSLEHIRLWVETLTGMEMMEHDTITPIDMDRLRAKRRELAALGGAPALPH